MDDEYIRGFDAGVRTAEWSKAGLAARVERQRKQLRMLEKSRHDMRSYKLRLRTLLHFASEYIPKDTDLYRDVRKLFDDG